MPITDHNRLRERSEQLNMFLRPPNRPTWGELPHQCRQEAQRLIARMFVDQITAGADAPADQEADHE